MPVNEIMEKGEDKMKKSIASTQKEFTSIRTGRANPMVLEGLNIDYYGAPTPIRQMANVSVQDGQTLVITPFDRTSIGNIEKEILKSDLGITPNNDGVSIRLVFPQPTEERRKGLVKEIKKIGEDSKIAIRNVRREMTDSLKKMEKDEKLPEDTVKQQQDEIQKITDKYIKEIDKVVSEKETEVMSI